MIQRPPARCLAQLRQSFGSGICCGFIVYPLKDVGRLAHDSNGTFQRSLLLLRRINFDTGRYIHPHIPAVFDAVYNEIQRIHVVNLVGFDNSLHTGR